MHRAHAGIDAAGNVIAYRFESKGFFIVEEDHGLSYRRALIEPLPEQRLTGDARDAIRNCRAKLESMLAPSV